MSFTTIDQFTPASDGSIENGAGNRMTETLYYAADIEKVINQPDFGRLVFLNVLFERTDGANNDPQTRKPVHEVTVLAAEKKDTAGEILPNAALPWPPYYIETNPEEYKPGVRLLNMQSSTVNLNILEKENPLGPASIAPSDPLARPMWRIRKLLREKADNYRDAKFSLLLSNLQANILYQHGKTHAIFAFVTFHEGKAKEAKMWLMDRGKQLTSAWDHLEGIHKGKTEMIDPIKCLYLSHAGYEYFDINRDLIPDDQSRSFASGMMKRTIFGKDFRQRENEYENGVHVLFLLASDHTAAIDKEKKKLIEEIADNGLGHIYFETARKNPEGTKDMPAREWFGFRDGITNPRFFPTEQAKAALFHVDEDKNRYEEPALLNQVLKVDSLGGAPHSCGSFLVFLKMEQHIAAFDNTVEELKHQLADPLAVAEALLIGRHKDGTPLTSSAIPGLPGGQISKFDYVQDADGLKCPFHAHIRKANPRTSESNSRMIVRRGMLYGSSPDEGKVGLLFMSFQRDLQWQFEDLVNRWMARYDPEDRENGSDPLVSLPGEYRSYSRSWNDPDKILFRQQQRLTTFRGGWYFFAPSISFFQNLLFL